MKWLLNYEKNWEKENTNTEEVKDILKVARDAAKSAADKSKADKDTRIHQKTTEIENHSKETAPAKATAEDDARLSKTKKKSE